MSEDNSKYKFTIGSTSLLLLLLIGGTLTALMLWASQPQYQGEGKLGAAMLSWVIMVFTGLPLLIASLATGITAIARNKGRIEGIIALSAISILILWVVITSIFPSWR